MKEIFKKKSFLILAGLLVLLIIVSILYMILDKKEPLASGEENKIEKVEVDEVTTLYNTLSNVDCTKALVWEFDKNNIIHAKDISNDIKIKMVLSLLNNNNLLDDKLTDAVFNEYVGKMFGSEVELNYVKTVFNGKEYDIDKEKTTITDKAACKESNYKSKLYGFSYNENELSIDVAVGYIKDNALYDLDDNKVSEYKEDSEINELLYNSTIYRYGFKLGKSYYLDNVTKVVTIKASE